MIKKISLFLLSFLLLLSFTCPTAAKAPQFIKQVFNAPQEKINQLSEFDLTNKELSLTLYLTSLSDYPLTKRKVKIITSHSGNWAEVTWRFGLPPIIPEDGSLVFRRPQPPNNLPPGQKNFRYFNKGMKEQLTSAQGKYIYTYNNRRLKIKQQIKITDHKYKYKYHNIRRGIKETLKVKFPSGQYKYHYSNRETREKINRKGTGDKITPSLIYQRLKRKQQAEDFQLSLSIDIHF